MGNTEGLAPLLEYVSKQSGIDFALYRHATILRKLDLRLQATKAASYAAYLEYLRVHPAEMEDLIGALTIKVTSFFRNPLVFEILASCVMPEAISRFGSLRIWSLGCASGEEPYSLAIIAGDLLKKEKKPVSVEILGTDIDARAIGKAVRGEYPEEGIADVRKRHVDEFFRIIPDHASKHLTYRISDSIRSIVRFESGDIISGVRREKDEGRKYHIILCRNLLIYMSRDLQEEVLNDIFHILHVGGYVVIGESETIPDKLSARFARDFPGVKIYGRKSLSP